MWFHFWIAFHLYDIAVAVAPVTCDVGVVVAFVSSMMQSTLTLKIDKVDVSMAFVAYSRTHIILYKLEIFGLDFSGKIFFSSLATLSNVVAIDLIRTFSFLSLLLIRTSICDVVSFICILLLITNDYLILMWNTYLKHTLH